MIATRVRLPNKSQVLILEDIFPQHILQNLHNLCREWNPDMNPDWVQPVQFNGAPRWNYEGNNPWWQDAKNWLGSDYMLGRLQGELGCEPLQFDSAVMWMDQQGFGPLGPHKENSGSYLCQIYLTETEHSYTGTTIHNDNKQILFQLPYRDNMGWFFDTGRTVMHGREHDVPAGINRFTMMAWFRPRDDYLQVSL
jgi:hypothetical protein